MRIAFPFLIGLTMIGCTAGPPPKFDTPPPPLPSTFAFMVDAETSADVDALLPADDPAYTKLAASALAQGPSLAQAIARIEQARAGAARASADRSPVFGADASAAANRINPDQFGATFPPGVSIDTQRVSYGTNVTASWDLDLFGRLRAREAAASARVDVATADAAVVRDALLAEIATSIIDWRTLAARQLALEADLTAAQTLAQLAGARERAGIAPEFDRVRAESAIAASRSRIAALESERTWVLGKLITLTGEPAQSVIATVQQTASPSAISPPPSSLPSLLLSRRPDVLAAAANLAAADADLAAAAARRFPQLNLSAALGFLAFNPSKLFDDDSLIGSAGASVLFPLIDFGRIQAEIDVGAAGKRIAFAAYRDAVFKALGDAETAYGLVSATDRELAAAIAEAETSGRAGRLADMRYRAGLSDFLTALEARRTADASGERAAAARGRAQRARVLLWRALGGSLGIKPPLQPR